MDSTQELDLRFVTPESKHTVSKLGNHDVYHHVDAHQDLEMSSQLSPLNMNMLAEDQYREAQEEFDELLSHSDSPRVESETRTTPTPTPTVDVDHLFTKQHSELSTVLQLDNYLDLPRVAADSITSFKRIHAPGPMTPIATCMAQPSDHDHNGTNGRSPGSFTSLDQKEAYLHDSKAITTGLGNSHSSHLHDDLSLESDLCEQILIQKRKRELEHELPDLVNLSIIEQEAAIWSSLWKIQTLQSKRHQAMYSDST